jgi:hypothetical protein
MPHLLPPSFGIMAPPQQVTYADLLQVWREADAIPAIEHAWLFDHLMPIGGDPTARPSRAGHCYRPWPPTPSGFDSAYS